MKEKTPSECKLWERATDMKTGRLLDWGYCRCTQLPAFFLYEEEVDDEVRRMRIINIASHVCEIKNCLFFNRKDEEK